jgi:hypothetical protein
MHFNLFFYLQINVALVLLRRFYLDSATKSSCNSRVRRTGLGSLAKSCQHLTSKPFNNPGIEATCLSLGTAGIRLEVTLASLSISLYMK